jgi:hypothetical protein
MMWDVAPGAIKKSREFFDELFFARCIIGTLAGPSDMPVDCVPILLQQ